MARSMPKKKRLSFMFLLFCLTMANVPMLDAFSLHLPDNKRMGSLSWASSLSPSPSTTKEAKTTTKTTKSRLPSTCASTSSTFSMTTTTRRTTLNDTKMIHHSINNDMSKHQPDILAPDAETTTTTTTTTPLQKTPVKKNQTKLAQAAILLNRNARQVTPELESMVISIFGAEHVYGTSTEEEARRIASTCLIQNNNYDDDDANHNNIKYSMIIPIGGDGTLASLIQFMCDGIMNTTTSTNMTNTASTTEVTTNATDLEVEQQQSKQKMTISKAMARLPLMAYIPMGTGNGVGSVVGCSPPLSLQTQRKRGRTNLWKRLTSSSVLFGSRRRKKMLQLETTLRQLKTISENIMDQQLKDKYEIVELPMIQVTSRTTTPTITTTTTTSTNTTTTHNANQQVETERSDLCFFAGIGFDSLLLHDFQQIKSWSKRTGIMKRFLSSVAGYCVALVVKTLPQCAFSGKHKIHVELTTATRTTKTHDADDTTTPIRDSPTLWIDHRRGDMALPCHDELLYKGSTGILSASTVPYYGGGLRMFPFSRITTDTTMQVRLGRIHPIKGCMNLPSIFAGSYRDKHSNEFGVLDFIGKDFEVKVINSGGKDSDLKDDNKNDSTPGFPLQHSGESIGSTKQFRLKVLDAPVRFVSLWEPRVVVEDQPDQP